MDRIRILETHDSPRIAGSAADVGAGEELFHAQWQVLVSLSSSDVISPLTEKSP